MGPSFRSAGSRRREGRERPLASRGMPYRFGVVCVTVLAVGACGASDGPRVHSVRALAVATNRQVLLAPPLQAGFAGWCVVIAQPGGCVNAPAYSGPIVTIAWRSSGRGAHLGAILTTGSVASISFDEHRAMRTRAEPSLPDGLRAVVVETHAQKASQLPLVPSEIAAFDAKGDRVQQAAEAGRPLVEGVLPSVPWKRPALSGRGVCEISGGVRRVLEPEWGSVTTAARSYVGPLGGAFVSCAWTQYYAEGWPLEVAALLDAAHPGATPPELPAMRSIPGHPGLFEVPTGSAMTREDAVVRRVSHAWLVVAVGKSGSEGAPQRVTAIEHLHVAVHL
jgi:hypothetical protein